MVAPRSLILVAMSTICLAGCTAAFQDLHYSLVNKSRAEYAWYSGTTVSQRWQSSSDYAHGYKHGFSDASTGKACALPAVPPPCYWSTKYQCCEGQQHIQDWYRGYQSGVAAAEGAGFPSFHNVPLGPQAPVVNKDGCGMCYAPTGCACETVPTVVAPIMPNLQIVPRNVESKPAPTAAMSPLANQLDISQGYDLGLIGPVGSANDLPTSSAEVRTASAVQQAEVRPIIQ